VTLIGDVKGKDVIIFDDMVDTAGTLCAGADVLLKAGALSVNAFITHPVLSGAAFSNIKTSGFDKLYVSDSLVVPTEVNIPLGGSATQLYRTSDKIEVVGIAHQIGMAIAAINNNMSYDALKKNENNKLKAIQL
jgi:ribose-phosphate pyrophosphokinase